MCDEPAKPLHSRLRTYCCDDRLKALDLRCAADFEHRRLQSSHNIPAPELPQRLFELPPKSQPFAVVAPLGTAQHWSEWFGKHGWTVPLVFAATEQLWIEAATLGCSVRDAHVPRTLLFQPCPLLGHYASYIERSASRTAAWRCLDVGCGSGRDMIFLGTRGWKCLGLDNWAAAVARSRSAAVNYGLEGNIKAERVDVSVDGTLTMKPGGAPVVHCHQLPSFKSIEELKESRFELVLNVRFLNRALVTQLRSWVATQGFVLFSTFLEDPDASDEVQQRYPKGSEHRLRHDELGTWFSPAHGFVTVCDEEHVLDDGRKVSHFLAQKRM